MPHGHVGRSLTSPTPVSPLAGERISESIARFEVSPGADSRDVRIVAARFAFDPSGWTSLPGGPAWTVLPVGAKPTPLASLGLSDGTDTPLWWTVVWTDARTGAIRAGEVREFTLVPRFSNRAGAGRDMPYSASGRLDELHGASAHSRSTRPTIDLAAGYSLVPRGPLPELPSELKRAGAAAAGARSAFIVQFGEVASDLALDRIVSAGGNSISPIAGEAYLVRLDDSALAKLRDSEGDPWVTEYQPAYKLSPALERSAAGRVDATALLFADGDDAATVAALRSIGAEELSLHGGPLNHLVRFKLDRSRLASAALLEDVAWIEPSPEFRFDNDLAQWVVQSGIPNSRPVFGHGIRGQGQVVMTSDSGIRTNHEMFFDSTLAINGWGDYPTHRKIVAYKPGSPSSGIAFGDHVGFDYHGTHTGGTVAGNPEPFSSAPWSGTAKDARIYFMDVGGAAGGGLYLPDDLNDLFQPSYTGNAGGAARISSNSWGASSSIGSYTLSSMQADQFVWNHPDYLIAFASGNVGVFGAVNSPGTAKNVLTVGATWNDTLQNEFANFSSRGPTRDGRRKPLLVAPGHLVTSSVGSTRYTYGTYSGTSMATPAAAGAMALVRQYLTEGWYPTGAPVAANGFSPSAALLKSMAVAAARNDVIGFSAPDNSIGYGRLTIDDVLYFPGDSSRTLLVDPADGLSNGQFVEYQVQVTDPSRPLKVALCWTDAPGHPASQVQIVNDLDLVVTKGSATYLGNYLLNNVSASGGWRDSLNVEEFVRLAAPAPGLWTVRVEGRRVMQGPQRFALCITGGVGASTGAVALDRFEYSLSDTLGIEVVDANASGPLTVQVTSSTEQWSEIATLTGSNGIFRGSIPVAPVPAQYADGILAVSSGDLVTVTYDDASPGVQVAATARVNVQTPTITNVSAVAAGATQAVVRWSTDLSSTSRVRFGASAALGTTIDSSGHTVDHAVLLTGLNPSTTYWYDVESVTRSGDVSRDSVGGAHRSFTTRPPAGIALLMDDPDESVLTTWNNALAALGWDADVHPAAANDPPLVGNSSRGLRSYNAVLWQVGQDNYPPFSDAQRAAVDSLLEGGGRLLVTGHDIGYGLSSADVFSYSPEREAWLENTLKTRYFLDNYYANLLTGVAGSPVAGAFTGSVPYLYNLYPDAGDNVGPAPGTNGVWTGDWTDDFLATKHMGMHWESNVPDGTSGVGVWGGHRSRLVGMFFEWRALSGSSTSSLNQRTSVLQKATSWLFGHAPPEVHLVLPAPGTVVTSDFVAVRYSLLPDSGRVIASRLLDYSLDGGATWTELTTAACTDSGCIWDLAGALGGAPVPNSTRAMLRVRVADDGSPVLRSHAVMNGTFTLARSGGDTRGPVLVAGSASCSPLPVRRGLPATLFATFSDLETGGGGISAAEYSIGPSPLPAGSGTAMAANFGAGSVRASAALPTAGVTSGSLSIWLRARDSSGNWGAATAYSAPSSGTQTVSVDAVPMVDFLATPTPNPFRGNATVRFGLARAGEARLELFDLSGRRVRTLVEGVLAPGSHSTTWDGRDQRGNAVGLGVYFLRLVTPERTLQTRVVALK